MGSITFVQDGEVWVMPAADPDGARPLTATGGQVVAQAQDDVGRVVVGLDGGDVIWIDRTG